MVLGVKGRFWGSGPYYGGVLEIKRLNSGRDHDVA